MNAVKLLDRVQDQSVTGLHAKYMAAMAGVRELDKAEGSDDQFNAAASSAYRFIERICATPSKDLSEFLVKVYLLKAAQDDGCMDANLTAAICGRTSTIASRSGPSSLPSPSGNKP